MIYCTTEGFFTQILLINYLLINCKVIIRNCKEMSLIPTRCTFLEFYGIHLSYRYIF